MVASTSTAPTISEELKTFRDFMICKDPEYTEPGTRKFIYQSMYEHCMLDDGEEEEEADAAKGRAAEETEDEEMRDGVAADGADDEDLSDDSDAQPDAATTDETTQNATTVQTDDAVAPSKKRGGTSDRVPLGKRMRQGLTGWSRRRRTK